MAGARAGQIGVVVDYDDLLKIFLVNTTNFSQAGYHEHELKPLFTLDQVVAAKIEEEETPALVKAAIPFGMTSEELATEVAQFVAECASRISGVGRDQYELNGHQKFEELDLDELFQYAEEELQDIANYACFLAIRLRRIRAALDARDDLGVGTEEEFAQTDYSVEDFEENGNG